MRPFIGVYTSRKKIRFGRQAYTLIVKKRKDLDRIDDEKKWKNEWINEGSFIAKRFPSLVSNERVRWIVRRPEIVSLFLYDYRLDSFIFFIFLLRCRRLRCWRSSFFFSVCVCLSLSLDFFSNSQENKVSPRRRKKSSSGKNDRGSCVSSSFKKRNRMIRFSSSLPFTSMVNKRKRRRKRRKNVFLYSRQFNWTLWFSFSSLTKFSSIHSILMNECLRLCACPEEDELHWSTSRLFFFSSDWRRRRNNRLNSRQNDNDEFWSRQEMKGNYFNTTRHQVD